MDKGSYIEVQWTLENGEKVWWPAMVWSSRPDTGELLLAYARAHGHPAHAAEAYLVDDHHLLDAEQQLYLRHRPLRGGGAVHFSAEDMVALTRHGAEGEESAADVAEARRALSEDMSAENQQRLWDGMEAFRQRVRRGLRQHGGSVVTEEDVQNLLT